jgi:predicted RNA binding protein YcfA (HicA-like mRNA interferase family)
MTDRRILDILDASKDRNMSFSDLRSALNKLGFTSHVKGDHFIYTKSEISEIINIQPQNGKAKPYQVRQVREIINKYHLQQED